ASPGTNCRIWRADSLSKKSSRPRSGLTRSSPAGLGPHPSQSFERLGATGVHECSMLRGTVNRNARLRWPALTGLLGWAVTAVMAEPSDSASAPTSPSIPFEFVSGRVLVSGRINDARSATLMLDTGYSVNMLSRELVDSLELNRIGHITIVGIAGEETADQFEGVTFSLGAASYKPRRVAALPPSY